MPAKLFGAEVAQRMADYVKEITVTPRERFEMTVISLLGSLLRRIDLVSQKDETHWFSKDPDPDIPGQPVKL